MIADKARAYDVYTAADVSSCCVLLKDLIESRTALVITTPTVAKLLGREIYNRLRSQNPSVSFMVLNCKEASKSIEQVLLICDQAMQMGLDRSGLLVGIGGGVCTDIVTVAASWIRRGVGYIRVPTTLVGQVDAGIGIKGAVNFHEKKSYLGSFYPPRAVVVVPAFLQTLPHRHMREGFAEIIKMAVIRNQRLFELTERHSAHLLASGFLRPETVGQEILSLSIAGMLNELQSNIYEDRNPQRLVDFGHTFSPALEAASNFSISHGEAVAIDMALSAVLGNKLGLLSDEANTRILHVLIDLGLPIWSPLLSFELCQNALYDMALHRGGRPNLVIPREIGTAVFVNDISVLETTLGPAIRILDEIGATITTIKQTGRQAVATDSISNTRE